jgi:hypothetical protein
MSMLAPTDDALDPDSTLAITLARIGNEITSIVRPETIVILVPLRYVPLVILPFNLPRPNISVT